MAEEIRNISLSQKKSFSIDGDINRIIQIDTSDLNVMVRLEEVYPDLLKLAVEATDRLAGVKDTKPEDGEDETTSHISDYSEILKDIDNQMREKVDYIFASEVVDICLPKENLYSVSGGEFKFEHLIDVLLTLYANDIKAEFKKMQERVKKHTDKYTKRRRK